MKNDALEAKKLEAEIAALEARRKESEANEKRLRAQTKDLELSMRYTVRDNKNLDAESEWSRIYMFDSEVNQGSVKKCIETLDLWSRRDGTDKAMRIIFNSPGGSVFHGFALYDFLQELRRRGHHITTVSLGYAASMGGVLLQAGDKRVLGENSYMLIHEVSSIGWGKQSELEDEAAFTKRLCKRILKVLAKRSTLTDRQIETRWKRKDWWLDSSECLEYGFIDEVQEEPAFSS